MTPQRTVSIKGPGFEGQIENLLFKKKKKITRKTFSFAKLLLLLFIVLLLSLLLQFAIPERSITLISRSAFGIQTVVCSRPARAIAVCSRL